MNDIQTHTHANGFLTEIIAFERADKTSKSIKAKILEELDQAGETGITPDEFVEMHGGLINTIRRRFTDLWKDGKIRHHPEALTRKNAAGNPCVTWVLGQDPNSQKKRPQRPIFPVDEATMSEYIAGFDAGYAYVLQEIERNPRMTTAELLRHLKGEKVEIGPSILPTREKDRHCD